MAYEYPAVEEDAADPENLAVSPASSPEPRQRSTPARRTALDEIADDLALWIDDTANKIALAFAPGRAPFSAALTEDQKLAFYKAQLFNPDGSPNQAGRQAQIQRLGTEGFSNVYKAVVQAYPELKPPEPAPLEVPEEWPAVPGGVPPAPPGLAPPGPPPTPPGLAAPPSLEQLRMGGP